MDSSRRALTALAIAIAATCGRAQSLTEGWSQYADTFYVQNRTSAPMDQRYTFADGVHSCQVYKGEERVEMRWNTWPNQDVEHMWEADMMFEVGTSNTCVMQVKSNESGEAVYMQVFNGDLHWGAQGTPTLVAGLAGKWYHMNVAWNRATGVGRVWIDGELKATRNHDKGVNWYFKNGTYGTNNHSKSNYKSIRTWVHIPSSAVIRLPALRAGGEGRAVIFDARGAWRGERSGGRASAMARGAYLLRVEPAGK